MTRDQQIFTEHAQGPRRKSVREKVFRIIKQPVTLIIKPVIIKQLPQKNLTFLSYTR